MTLALDLGTTRIKLAHYDQNGRLQSLTWRDAPKPEGPNLIRVSDPEVYREMAGELLQQAEAPPGTRLGIACQRSSFLLWERGTGKPVCPLISWQDTRAVPWRKRKAHLESWRRTGLPLSSHYAGPKLAFLLEQDPELGQRARSGDLLFGTLESWLIRCWAGIHVTGLGIAARTTLLDLDGAGWNDERLQAYGIPACIMPEIVDVAGKSIAEVFGYDLCSILADQAAGTMPVFAAHPDSILINAGTGIFVMRPHVRAAPQGYLTARVGCTPMGMGGLMWEGSINGGARLWEGLEYDGHIPGDCHAVGDTAGLGSPYWRADLADFCSPQTLALPELLQHKVKARSLLFRVRQVVEDLGENCRIILSGGLAQHPRFPGALATVLSKPLAVAEDSETGLWGTAWAARGFDQRPHVPLKQADPAGVKQDETYRAWKHWLMELIRKDELSRLD